MQLLQKLTAEGHQTLLFSQSRLMLDMLEAAIRQQGWRFCRIDGRVSNAAERHVSSIMHLATPFLRAFEERGTTKVCKFMSVFLEHACRLRILGQVMHVWHALLCIVHRCQLPGKTAFACTAVWKPLCGWYLRLSAHKEDVFVTCTLEPAWGLATSCQLFAVALHACWQITNK